MAWTTPKTWTLNETVESSELNTHVKDNLNETAPGKATTAGALFVATGANAIAETPVPSYLVGDATYTGSSTTDDTYLSLAGSAWGSGTNVAITMTTSARVMLMYGVGARAAAVVGHGVTYSYDVSGATTVAASDNWAGQVDADDLSVYQSGMRMHYRGDMTPGSNTFRLVVKSSDISDTVLFRPFLFVMSL